MPGIVDTEGRTAGEFLDETFEFEYCSCCGGDAEDHEVVPMSLGDYGGVYFFARCKQETVNEERAA
jgi:hypothetical protein